MAGQSSRRPSGRGHARKGVGLEKEFVARAGNDVIARRKATVSCNSFLCQASALFSRRNVLDKLKGIELPEVLPFDGVSAERRVIHCVLKGGLRTRNSHHRLTFHELVDRLPVDETNSALRAFL